MQFACHFGPFNGSDNVQLLKTVRKRDHGQVNSFA